MKRFKRILVATDSRLQSHPVVEAAGDLARQNEAEIRLVDVVPELPWLTKMTVERPAHVMKLLREEKHEALEKLAETLRAQGIEATTKVLTGRSSIEIVREVVLGRFDLVMRIAKGLDSRRKGAYGSTALQLLRKCPCPVWLATRQAPAICNHVVGCVDVFSGDEWNEELNQQIFELGSSLSAYHSGRFSLIHAWELYGEPLFRARLPEGEVEELIRTQEGEVNSLLQRFLEKQNTLIPHGDVHLLKGFPNEVIPTFIHQEKADLVVMGTVARSGVAGMILGNTAEQILDKIDCSVLALKPSSFKTNIR